MTITDIIRNTKGRAGSGGSWRVDRSGDTATLWHYATPMLTWNVNDPADADVLDYSTGHGSVSDQGGMNQAFRALGLPLRFDRDGRGGGPRITDIADRLAAA